MIHYIVGILEKNGIVVPDFNKNIKFENIFSVNKREEINNIVISKGGVLLSDVYFKETTKVLVKCKRNHDPWWVTPYHLRADRWCPDCRYLNNTNDFVGKEFGRLVVIERDKSKRDRGRNAFWKCRCKCNNENECVVSSASLNRGATQSCGCLLKEYYANRGFKNLVGEKIGMLMVTERTREKANTSGDAFFKCTCECGNETTKSGRWLRAGKPETKSCGCIKLRNRH